MNVLEGTVIEHLQISEFPYCERPEIALVPKRIKRTQNFRRMLSRIMPLEGVA